MNSVLGRNELPLAIREGVTARAGGRCERCGADGLKLEFSHIRPVVFGGADSLVNVELVCRPCHKERHQEAKAKYGRHPQATPPRGRRYPAIRTIGFSLQDMERLEKLAAKLELPLAAVVRRAVRELAEKEGVG